MLEQTVSRVLRPLVKTYRSLAWQPGKALLAGLFDRYTKRYVDKSVIAEIEGIHYELVLGEVIDRSIFCEGSFERDTSAALLDKALPGMTVLDIGANIGWHTCRLAKRVRPGKVIAFEPMSWARRKLLRNLDIGSNAI